MTKLTESAIEDFATKLLNSLGFDYIHAPIGDSKQPKLMSGKVRVKV